MVRPLGAVVQVAVAIVPQGVPSLAFRWHLISAIRAIQCGHWFRAKAPKAIVEPRPALYAWVTVQQRSTSREESNLKHEDLQHSFPAALRTLDRGLARPVSVLVCTVRGLVLQHAAVKDASPLAPL